MRVKIGKLLPNGCIRHIEVFHEGESNSTAFVLKNFYSTDKRVDALLDLGNLNNIGPSPYGKRMSHTVEDMVHCFAAIRDDGANKKKNEALESGNREAFTRLAELCYLYENGKWTVLIGKYSGNIEYPGILRLAWRQSFADLEIFEFQKGNELSKVYANFSDWKELVAYADTENKTLYVFRNNRLVSTINHPLKKEIA
jgi:hypothetical protein